jgi:hypothetical protein
MTDAQADVIQPNAAADATNEAEEGPVKSVRYEGTEESMISGKKAKADAKVAAKSAHLEAVTAARDSNAETADPSAKGEKMADARPAERSEKADDLAEMKAVGVADEKAHEVELKTDAKTAAKFLVLEVVTAGKDSNDETADPSANADGNAVEIAAEKAKKADDLAETKAEGAADREMHEAADKMANEVALEMRYNKAEGRADGEIGILGKALEKGKTAEDQAVELAVEQSEAKGERQHVEMAGEKEEDKPGGAEKAEGQAAKEAEMEADDSVGRMVAEKSETIAMRKNGGRDEAPDAPAVASHSTDSVAVNTDDVITAAPVTPVATSGRRERKAPVKFDVTGGPTFQRRMMLRGGNGTALRDIPNVEFAINAAKGRDDVLILLHRLMFNSVGIVTKRKPNIRAFSGWTYDDPIKDRERLVLRLNKEPTSTVKKVATFLDLSNPSGSKPEVVNSIITFLQHPKAGENRPNREAVAKKKKDERKNAIHVSKTGGITKKVKNALGKLKKTKPSDTDSESGTDDDEVDDDDNVGNVATRFSIVSSAKGKAKGKKRAEVDDNDDDSDEDDDNSDSDDAEDSAPRPKKKTKLSVNEIKKEKSAKANIGKATKTKATKAANAAKAKAAAAAEEEEGGLEEGEPTRKELETAADEIVANGDGEKMTIRSLRTSLERKFGSSLKNRMSVLRRIAADKLG